jgi:hypothetical protein
MSKKPTGSWQQTITKWRRWKYENTTLLILSLILVFYLAQTPVLDSAINALGNLGYIGAFIVGNFFVSTFTVAPAGIVLYHLADQLHPVEVALLAGAGAMLGDYVMFRFMRDKVFDELRPMLMRLQTPKVKVLFKSPYFAWLLPLVGAFIIASPFPDEIGVSMLGASKIKQWQFFALAFVLNSIGIFFIVSIARWF